MKVFMAADGTKMTFEMVKEISGCQQFKVTVDGQTTWSITLAGLDTEVHYKTLEILLMEGVSSLKNLEHWPNSIEPPREL